MKGELTTTQIFYIIIFLIGLVIFIIGALWFKGYGLNVITTLPGLISGIVLFKGKTAKNNKGLSLTMNAVWLLLAVAFIIIVLMVYNTIFPGGI
jgi:hypothetical protein